MLKIEKALIFQKFYGKWKLMKTADFPKGLITPEQYQTRYGVNRDDIMLKCPCRGIDGEPCAAELEFTGGTDTRTSYFSTKDNRRHAFGCILTTDGTKRKQIDESRIRKDLDFSSFLNAPADGESTDNDVGGCRSDLDYKSDKEDDIALDGLEQDDMKSTFNSDDDCQEDERITLKRQMSEKVRGFRGLVINCLEAYPADAASNGFLLNDQMICARTSEVFHERIIRLEKGSPILLFAKKWPKFSADYSDELGRGYDLRIMRNLYYDSDYTNIYLIKIDKLGKKGRDKFKAIYNNNNEKNYHPEAFVLGVVYDETISKKVGGKMRSIDVFSLLNVKNIIAYDAELKEIDEENTDI